MRPHVVLVPEPQGHIDLNGAEIIGDVLDLYSSAQEWGIPVDESLQALSFSLEAGGYVVSSSHDEESGSS